jgi:hypothetical protein
MRHAVATASSLSKLAACTHASHTSRPTHVTLCTHVTPQGLRERYEAHHKLRYTDEALMAAAKYSSQYISDRFLPDKVWLRAACMCMCMCMRCVHVLLVLWLHASPHAVRRRARERAQQEMHCADTLATHTHTKRTGD